MTSSSYKIIVRNLSQTTQYFYVFQKQATFDPPTGITCIYCSSLGCQNVGNYGSSGAQIVFGLDRQVYAGAVSTAPPVPPSQSAAANTLRTSRLLVSTTTTARSIALTTGTGGDTPANFTDLTLNPLGLSVPTYQSGIMVGAFAVRVPSYTPAPFPQLFCGVAALNADQVIILSSFVAPIPSVTVSCAPEQIFFVKTGYQPAGNNIAYDEGNAARCDFTPGFATITATYNANGTFTTTQGP